MAKLLNLKVKKHAVRTDVPFYLLLAPAIVLTFAFAYMPMPGIIMAFKDMTNPRLSMWKAPWAGNYGFEHFIYIFSTPALTKAIWNTLWLNALGLVIRFPAPLIFALLLNEVSKKTFKRTVQTVSYLPYFLSWIAVTGLAVSMLEPYGTFNNILARLGLNRIDFLERASNFTPIYVFLTVWKGVGWGAIIYLANIAAISTELYEAATLDGANRFRRVWHITLPALLPTVMILLILDLGQIFGSNFELAYGLQSPYMDVDVIATAVYKWGIGSKSGDPAAYSQTTALGLMQSVIALVLTFGANTISKKVSSVSLW
jgi:putative aldouronate transport system permease protein